MGLPSYEADIFERALDNQVAMSVFGNGSAGAAGIGRPARAGMRISPELIKAKRAEAEAADVERRTKRFVDDRLAWIQETLDIMPLPRRN
jgi:hypothetical protein